MKMTVLGIALASVLLVPAAYGVDEHHPEKAAPGAKAPKASASPQADDKSVAQMQEHMKKMQDLMARLQKTTDPAAAWDAAPRCRRRRWSAAWT